MPNSVIFRYINEEREELLSIWSYEFMKQQLKTAIQLIEFIGIKQTEQERYETIEMCEGELLCALNDFMKLNELKVMMPN